MTFAHEQTATRSDGVHHLSGQSRYTYTVAGEQVGIADYWISGDALHISHTEVDPRWRGTAIAARMVQQILDLLHAETEYRIVPDCPFVAEFIARNPQYRQLTASGV